jgi:tetratricopeptide (TPR) repeat protein
MTLHTFKSFVKNSTFQTCVIVISLFIGGGMIASSLYRHYSPEPPERVNYDTIQSKKPAVTDSLYRACMRKGDNFFAEKLFEKAIAEYQNGLKLRPKDSYATDRLAKAKAQIEARAKAESDYAKYITSGDNYFNSKDYLNAKGSYQLAIDAKPDDPYAKGKLKETMDLLRSMKASNILYDVAIASAEKLFQEKDYEKAMAEFENAGKILPDEKYPKDRINQIIKIMIDKQTNDEMYTRSITSADKLYNSKAYQSALLEYQHAASYKPDEKYPKDRIKELTDLIAAMKARDEAYKKSIAAADKLFDDRSFEPSKAEYQNASKIKPEEIYPINRIKEIETILARLKNVKEEYERLVNLADSLYIGKKHLEAKINYQEALKVKPNEPYPKEMISKADNLILGQEANSKALQEAYQAALSNADKLYEGKEYDKAKSGYQTALGIKPDEQYPKDKIKEIDLIFAALEKQKEQDKQYLDIIAAADKLLTDKSYQPAKVQYQSALKLKPGEKYPQDRITEIDLALSDLVKQKALDDQYAAAVSKADKSFASKTWDQAKTDYSSASSLKPNETYPKDKIAEIEKILADLAKQKIIDDQYAGIIAGADKLLEAKTYADARTEYSKAGELKPSENYPKTKIAEIDRILAAIEAQKSLDEQYNGLIEKADRLLADKSYEQAKTEYQNAAVVKPAEAYPKGKIIEINAVLAEIAKKKALDDQYASAIANADKLLADKSYQPAKVQYQSALKLKPGEKYPQDRITEIDLALSDLAKQKALDDQYTLVLTKADKSFAAKIWDQAKTDYTAASALKPNESYPKDKIVEIDKIVADLAKQKAIDDQYAGIIAGADKLLEAKTYADARTEYGKAGDLKPTEAYPKTKIAEIDKILADIEAQKSKDEQYKGLIDKADKLLADKSYEPAKTEYQNAIAIKPAEVYPKGKIEEIDKVLAEIAKKKALDDLYASTITGADKLLADKSYELAKAGYQKASLLKPDEKYPKDRIAEIDIALANLAKQKAIDDQYTAAISKADKSFAAKTWEQAKTDYTVATVIKPNESYPKDKIVEIDKIVADLAKQKAIDDQYAGIIANADKLLSAKTYAVARTEYGKATDLKPSEEYPKTKIAEIDKILGDIAAAKLREEQYKALIDKADKLLADKSYEPAKTEYQNAIALKPTEAYPKGKIEEIDKVLAGIAKKKALDDQYASTITDADKLLADKSYEPAKAGYQKASQLKPEEKYPKDRIAEIDLALANLAKQKALDDQYNAVIAKADKLLQEKSYEQAKTEYTNAGNLKPAEQYPKDKIAEILKTLDDLSKQKVIDDKYQAAITNADKLLDNKTYELARAAYVEATGLKPAEQYPKDKIALIDKILADIAHQKEIDAEYKSSITKADQLLAAKSYEPAKTEYQHASSLKPAEEYPKGKITAIDKILADIKAFEDKYNGAIATGDSAFASKSYAQAKSAYQGALQMKPAEKYPKDKIAEIDKILADLAKQKVIDDQFNSSITKADKLLADKSYALAKTEYGTALTIKPAEQYPKDKMAEIDGIIADLKAKDDAYKAAVAKGNQLMTQKSYEEARTEYQNAGEIKPNEKYPKDKIEEINRILMELKGKRQTYDDLVSKGNDLLMIKDFYKAKDNFQQALSIFPDESYPKERLIRINSVIDSIFRANKVFYDKAIAEGDKNFNAMIFDKAIDSYQEAITYLPNEQYPKDRISQIKKTIAENAIVDVLNSAQTVTNGSEKQFTFTPVNIISRKNNYFYIKIRNLTDRPFSVMLRYGKDKQINGGAVIKNITGDGKVNERLISVREQDPWYRNDNNWISLYPQGGDVEVTFIQISRAGQ